VFADGDAEVAAERLEDDVDGLAARGACVWFGVDAGQVGDEE